MRPRSNTASGLTIRLLGVVAQRHPYAFAAAALGLTASLLTVAASLGGLTCGDSAHRVVTFNIERFPRSSGQIAKAFDLIETLEPDVLAVQEIMHPEVFAREARDRLGDHYAFAHTTPGTRGNRYQLGVLYDTRRYTLEHHATHPDLQVAPKTKPALEVVLRDRRSDRRLRVVTVHLASTEQRRALRQRQHRALDALLTRLRAADPEASVMILGDFNATSRDDRRALTALAAAQSLALASETLPCTAYWSRRDVCLGTPLDHVLTDLDVASIRAEGPCAEIGCAPGARCPDFFGEVSDHCPVMTVVR